MARNDNATFEGTRAAAYLGMHLEVLDAFESDECTTNDGHANGDTKYAKGVLFAFC